MPLIYSAPRLRARLRSRNLAAIEINNGVEVIRGSGMRGVFVSIIAISLAGAPVEARDWHTPPADVQAGAFIGARVRMPFGGHAQSQPRAELAIAPSKSRIAADGSISTGIGQGLAFGISPGSKPTLTLGGARADHLLGLTPRGKVEAERKLGLSTGAWIGIGVVAVVVVGAVLLSDYCDRKISSICGDEE